MFTRFLYSFEHKCNAGMISYRYPMIAKEGWNVIAIFILLAALISILLNIFMALPLWFTAMFFVFVYRDPARKVPPVPLAIVGIVDGKVLNVKTIKDPYIDREAISVTFVKTWFSIISLRSPIEGKVMEQWFATNHRSKNDDSKHSAQFSKGFAQWVQSDEGDDVVIAIYPNYTFQRPRCYVHSGERIGQGQRCGIIPFHSQVEVIVPANATVNVKPGDTVLAGTDTIATLRSSH